MQLVTILGQTSSGKSKLAVDLAKYIISKDLNACIVGCDSRQIFRDLNIGTGKIEGDWKYNSELKMKVFEFGSIIHFMIDFVDPKINYNLQNYITDFYDLMQKIQNQFDYVILVGGTGLYAKAINEALNLGSVKTEFLDQYDDYKSTLQALPIDKLQETTNRLLINLNNSDYNNKIRLVSNLLKAHSQDHGWLEDSKHFEFEKNFLFAIKINQAQLKSKIKARLQKRFNQGLIDEIQEFSYLGKDKFISLGLEYRLGLYFINGKIIQSELQTSLLTENLQYAKRQLTWLKKQKNLIWIRNLEEIIKELKL